MPTPITRASLTTNLENRYSNQSVGGAFNVQKTLGTPGSSPKSQAVIEGDTLSMNGNTFQSPNGFETNVMIQKSQFIDVQSNGNSGISRFLKGFTNKKYDP